MKKNQQKIVFFGGPGTGKTTIIKELQERGFFCMNEISREITKEAQEKGIDQLFLTDPILFSKMLLEGRERQFLEAHHLDADLVFFDRGIPEIFGYLNYVKTSYPEVFIEKSKKYRYEKIFYFPIWKDIYESDTERYESLADAKAIDKFLIDAYASLGYGIHQVPFGTIEQRAQYILNVIKTHDY